MYHALQHGGAPSRNPNNEMYPSVMLRIDDHLSQAAHRAPAMFSNTRLFDFSQKDTRRQAGLQQYLRRLANDGVTLSQGDIIGACAIGSGSLLVGYAWGVENPEAGVSFAIKTHFSERLLVNVNAAQVDSDAEMLDTPIWIKRVELLDIELTSFPASVPTDLRFWVSPIVITPQIGN
ncbi:MULTISPECIES: hypothetical protein [unclassified Paraburkholderia]|uniref:hypothetical protein n=1 Tax=unclassified Paraburkholderia TaxID=2615204 RepID=UPI0016225D5B|nr:MULTISPECIES: hypothetical protein [unclassified Paraburkholderia]MBB5448220.1 hypothetical protein [Paraburkholderia sp. WSM4177]MBB5488605.1 hypothetical protein [Paraburkholderia sp. WSM4180]